MKPHQHTVLQQVFLSAEWFVLRWGSLFGIIVNKIWCINTVFYSFISGHLMYLSPYALMSRLSFGQGFAQNWHPTVPRWTYSGLGLFFGVLVWFFPHILKFIIFWAGNKVFSFLKSTSSYLKNTLKNNPIHIFCLRLKIYFKHLHVICRENLTFSGQQVNTETFFI